MSVRIWGASSAAKSAVDWKVKAGLVTLPRAAPFVNLIIENSNAIKNATHQIKNIALMELNHKDSQLPLSFAFFSVLPGVM
jgi:hypothetical protein